jgi:hypothetical protein
VGEGVVKRGMNKEWGWITYAVGRRQSWMCIK